MTTHPITWRETTTDETLPILDTHSRSRFKKLYTDLWFVCINAELFPHIPQQQFRHPSK